jgi:hypothetical protein
VLFFAPLSLLCDVCCAAVQRGASRDTLFAYFRGQSKKNDLTVGSLRAVIPKNGNAVPSLPLWLTTALLQSCIR